ASRQRSGTETEEGGLVVHRVHEFSRQNFHRVIGSIFAERHKEVSFDVLEGGEIFSDARDALRLVPGIPLVRVLHTPLFFHKELQRLQDWTVRGISLRKRAGIFGVRLIKKLDPDWPYSVASVQFGLRKDQDRLHALEADQLVAPSMAMQEIIVKYW